MSQLLEEYRTRLRKALIRGNERDVSSYLSEAIRRWAERFRFS